MGTRISFSAHTPRATKEVMQGSSAVAYDLARLFRELHTDGNPIQIIKIAHKMVQVFDGPIPSGLVGLNYCTEYRIVIKVDNWPEEARLVQFTPHHWRFVRESQLEKPGEPYFERRDGDVNLAEAWDYQFLLLVESVRRWLQEITSSHKATAQLIDNCLLLALNIPESRRIPKALE